MKPSKSLLKKILSTIIDEWGFEEVSKSLLGIGVSNGADLVNSRSENGLKRPRRHNRASAVHQTERTKLPNEKRKILIELAERFDRKEFLPSVADVREFLIMFGQSPIALKDRSDSFRVLLRFLQQLPIDRLHEIAVADSHSGPSRLGPLSDAISEAGGRIQRQKIFADVGN